MKNKLPLKIHCFFSNVFGTLLLIYGGVSYIALFWIRANYIGTIKLILKLPDIVFLGLLLLGVSQFLRYVSGQTDSQGWILRKGEFIIYLAIIIKIVQVIWSFCFLSTVTQKPIVDTILIATMVFVRILIMFGIAQSLRAMKYSSSKKMVDPD